MEKLDFIPNNDFMRAALEQAKISEKLGEVPVGAVIVKNNKIISLGINRRETDRSAILHAEICAIDEACRKLNTWRLSDCDLYVTLEPCPMCTGAIINSRIKHVVFGAFDEKSGSCASVINLFDLPFNHKAEVWGGVLEEQCKTLISSFFRNKR